MRIGIDIDGVLADFNKSFIAYTVKVTGRNLFPREPFEPPIWDYPQHYGYSETETNAVWEAIIADKGFWASLSSYPGVHKALTTLSQLAETHDIYFITSRPGVQSKAQTEQWLRRNGFDRPTVLISSRKGLCASALGLDHYIDDKPENIADVQMHAPNCVRYLKSALYNIHPYNDIHCDVRVDSIAEFVKAIELAAIPSVPATLPVV